MSFFYFRRIRVSRPKTVFNTRSRKQYLEHKETARTLIHERVTALNEHYKLPVGKITVRNQKSRWGSCSRKGNLNFNYKLAFLKPEVRDYVIIHEICHIKEFNHGAGFWNLVAEKVPNHKELRKQLKGLG